MLNTLNIRTTRRFKKDTILFVIYIMIYLCHSLLCISYFKIILHSGLICKSKYETTQKIRDIRTWKYGTAYIFSPKKSIFWKGWVCYSQFLLNFRLYSCIKSSESSTLLSIIPTTYLFYSFFFMDIAISSGIQFYPNLYFM